MANGFIGFKHTLAFMTQLARNNDRDWFADHKDRYESDVMEPALQFITAINPQLARFAPEFEAIPKKIGGSVMRVYRDTRFSRDKSPYKTNLGIQFRHSLGKDVHAPGYYLHIEPGDVFIAAGLWRPERAALAGIRDLIVKKPLEWKRARDASSFRRHFELAGDSLMRVPRGYPKAHPHVEDLMRKDYIASCALSDGAIQSATFVKEVARRFESASPLMTFLCKGVGVPF